MHTGREQFPYDRLRTKNPSRPVITVFGMITTDEFHIDRPYDHWPDDYEPGGKGYHIARRFRQIRDIETRLVDRLNLLTFDQGVPIQLLDAIWRADIESRFIRIVDEPEPKRCVIKLNQKGAEISWTCPDSLRLRPSDVRELRECIRESDVIVLTFELLPETIVELIKTASSLEVPIVVNAAPVMDKRYRQLPLHLASRLFVNRQEAIWLTELDASASPQQLTNALHMRYGIPEIIVTLGADGAAVFNEQVGFLTGRPPVMFQEKEVGAGDAFLARWICAEMGGVLTWECLEIANRFTAEVNAAYEEKISWGPQLQGGDVFQMIHSPEWYRGKPAGWPSIPPGREKTHVVCWDNRPGWLSDSRYRMIHKEIADAWHAMRGLDTLGFFTADTQDPIDGEPSFVSQLEKGTIAWNEYDGRFTISVIDPRVRRRPEVTAFLQQPHVIDIPRLDRESTVLRSIA